MSRPLKLTGLETQPLQRLPDDEISNLLDTALAEACYQLSLCLPKYTSERSFQLRTMTLFYREQEQDPASYAGFSAGFHSIDYGRPTVHLLDFEPFVCWTSRQDHAAELARIALGLRRYRLYIRQNNGHWRFCHAGQLLLPSSHHPALFMAELPFPSVV